MRKIIYPLVACSLLLTACNQTKSNNSNTTNSNSLQQQTLPTAAVDTNAYFDFDKASLYTIKIADTAIERLSISELANDKLLLNILISKEAITINDTDTIQSLKKIGFVKQVVDTSKYDTLKNIFTYKEHDHVDVTNCWTMFRDVLVFEKENTITGVAKLCFTCYESVISGTAHDAQYFGQSGDFPTLRSLLGR